MKKAISTSLILLANIVILAHALVPHCHQNKFPQVIASIENDALILFNHSHNDDSHHHDSDSHDCAISETIATAFIRLQQDVSQNNNSPGPQLPPPPQKPAKTPKQNKTTTTTTTAPSPHTNPHPSSPPHHPSPKPPTPQPQISSPTSK